MQNFRELKEEFQLILITNFSMNGILKHLDNDETFLI